MQSASLSRMTRDNSARYSETIDMLYEQNTFYIQDTRTVLKLLEYIPQTRLSSFRHLYLESPLYKPSSPSDPPGHWAEAITALEKFDGLRSLCVILRPAIGLMWEINGLEEPLKKAKFPVLRVIIAPFAKRGSFARTRYCERHQGQAMLIRSDITLTR
jgi:hypothetical protein